MSTTTTREKHLYYLFLPLLRVEVGNVFSPTHPIRFATAKKDPSVSRPCIANMRRLCKKKIKRLSALAEEDLSVSVSKFMCGCDVLSRCRDEWQMFDAIEVVTKLTISGRSFKAVKKEVGLSSCRNYNFLLFLIPLYGYGSIRLPNTTKLTFLYILK
ncbi:unnamed protein product [Amoebophrya sp. A120]|nr:unnamed protein product [Amoebophrya sp. A120]|eukprot:GSA120T00024283001.1